MSVWMNDRYFRWIIDWLNFNEWNWSEWMSKWVYECVNKWMSV